MLIGKVQQNIKSREVRSCQFWERKFSNLYLRFFFFCEPRIGKVWWLIIFFKDFQNSQSPLATRDREEAKKFDGNDADM